MKCSYFILDPDVTSKTKQALEAPVALGAAIAGKTLQPPEIVLPTLVAMGTPVIVDARPEPGTLTAFVVKFATIK